LRVFSILEGIKKKSIFLHKDKLLSCSDQAKKTKKMFYLFLNMPISQMHLSFEMFSCFVSSFYFKMASKPFCYV